MGGKSKIENDDMNRIREKIGQNLAKIRKDQGYTQDTMADIIGVSKSVISRYETGDTKIDAIHIGVMAEKLNIRPDAFFYYDELRNYQKIPGIEQDQPSIEAEPKAEYEPRQKVTLSINIETDDPVILDYARQNLLPELEK
jgi:transcriptional regulator with XRE-family HTH domain